jgi:PTS system ascorbate-specific IIA component
MVSVVVIAHSEIANSFAYCVEHILAKRVDSLHILAVKKTEDVESIFERASELIDKLNSDDGVLILCDLFGATPCNIAQKLVIKNKVELITGLNLPMLIRAVSYAKSDLQTVVSKAIEGANSGIIHISGDRR